VKGLVVNPQQKNVEFLLLDELQEGEELKGLSFRSAEGVGEFAVTVQDSNAIVDLMKISLLKEMVQKGIQVLGTKVVTRKGKLLGEVTEYSVDTESGELTEFFYNGSGGIEHSLPAHSIITIGKEVLVVEEEGTAANAGAEAPPPVKKETGNFPMGNDGSLEKEVPEAEKSELEIAALSSAAERELLISEPDPDPAEIFVQRQRQYLIGKTLLKDFKLEDGEIIAWENQVITEELFDRIYRLGTQKLMELTLSVRE